ncbi:patatin-like phospholipase family protein [Actinomycetospora chibensis]|uniref:Patatin-like phospholipase family protein n=1 Tax=Actinomycetospora chibensis TaxID=663606 RepID=A0ABV9RTA0_9PSEU|nr:patatin-like phospholipase family protein [Actinomycetospora chibensis]MDD7924460.1 patatin-like phospholipase family protein [Actinomycetospora chibensis]
MRIALAFQGGGSHTAFTAGVVSRLVERGAFDGHEIVAVSGTSGGAINALLTFAALRDDRRDRIPADLEDFWEDNAASGLLQRLGNAVAVGAGVAQSLGLAPPLNPYLVPPAFDGREEFRRLLRRHVDFDALDVPDLDARHPRLVLGAVDVRSGAFRAFDSRRDRITPDTVLASAAIPTLFRAIHVDGGAYWDGLFSQNPPVAPLLDDDPDELWVVQINPTRRDDEPGTTLDIADRRNELAGNLSLYQELASIEKIDQLLAAGTLTAASGYRQVAVRVLELDRSIVSGLLGAASKVNRDVVFLRDLRRRGGEQADVFLTSLRFEEAWNGGDVERLRTLLAGARLVLEPPFGRATDDVAVVLATAVVRDVTRKELVGEEVVWRVAASGTPGVLSVTFDAGRLVSLHLGPVPEDER